MSGERNKKIIKKIAIDVDKCTGCRACEVACAAFHAKPKYSSINPARSRIRIIADEIIDEYVPICGGDSPNRECDVRHIYIISGKEYGECSLCRAACPSRDLFKEPDSGLPLKCDMCESAPPLDLPWCVQVCGAAALTYVVREEDADGASTDETGSVETALKLLIDKFGIESVVCRLKGMG